MFGATPDPLVEVQPPKDLVDRFKRVEDRLDLKFIQFPIRDGIHMNAIKHWAIILKWAADDKRRQLIQRGDMAESSDFDVLAYLPVDCNVKDAFSYFERAAVGRLKDRGDVQHLVSRIHLFNDNVQKEAQAPAIELAEELIEANAGTLFRDQGKTIPKVILSGKPLPADMTKKETK